MPRSFVVLSLALLACSNASGDRDPVDLDVFATVPGAPTWASHRRSFAVGIESELRVAGARGEKRDIRSLECFDDSCTVEKHEQLFLVTPKARDFRIHAELEPRSGEPSSLDRIVPALAGDFVVLHPGPGPGLPFLGGMRIVWYVGLKEKQIAWSADRATVSVSPPFELVGRSFAAEGPDQDPFLRVEILAPLSEEITNGTVELETGTTRSSFPLVAVPRSEIAALHVAPAPDSMAAQRDGDEVSLERLAGNRITVPMRRGRNAWLVFETKSGVLGIAGTGDCLPAANATEVFDLVPYNPTFYALELDTDPKDIAPSDRPMLVIQGRKVGTGELLLAVGDVRGSVQVTTVVEGGF